MNGRFVCLAVVGVVLRTSAGAQSLDKPLQLASREPAFYAIVGDKTERADARSFVVLRAHITLRLHDATILEALRAIENQTSLSFAFRPTILPPSAKVTLDANDITVAAALTQILMDADVDVEIAPYGLASLVSRAKTRKAPEVATGTLVGRVIDSKSKRGLSYAIVILEGTGKTTTANDSGAFRIAAVESGSYTMVVRRLGYVAKRQSVTVAADNITNVESALDESPNELDQVVVTGSIVPTEVKALPTPITVISDSEIARQQPHSLTELFRANVPSGVSFDRPAAPYSAYMSVRGATDLPAGGNVKVFIDGVESASFGLSPIDPATIERIEVVRGPEAAALYGSGAIDGVVEIFTKRGDGSLDRPRIDLQATAADVQTPYAGFRGVLRQGYSGDVRGGSPDLGYTLGGGYTQTGNYIPHGEYSAMSSPSVYGGLHYSRGMASVDLSSRYFVNDAPQVFNPQFFTTNFPFYSKPNYNSTEYKNTTLGGTLTLQPTSWWRNTLTLGFDELTLDAVQRRARLTSPADTELGLSYLTISKPSEAFNTTVLGRFNDQVSASLTAGIDHWNEPDYQYNTGGALNRQGNINTDPSLPYTGYRASTSNSGIFVQGQLGVWDALFLTAAARAEWNTDFGDSVGVPISPRFGVSYVRTFGSTTVKLRSSWGSALIAPPALSKQPTIAPGSIVLGNQHLAPERQRGGDGGVDVAFGTTGSLGITYYNQTAVNLIQQVSVPSDSISASQNQNVGTVHNTGIEIEGALNVWRMTVRGNYSFGGSRVDHLASDYTGDLRTGDQIFDIPRTTAGAQVSFNSWWGMNIASGVTYVGRWTDYNYLAEFTCIGGLIGGNPSLCPDAYLSSGSSRVFLMSYPALVKANVSITQRLNRFSAVFVSVDNIGDVESFEHDDILPVFGRITTIGLRLNF